METASLLHFSIQHETAPESRTFTSQPVRVFTRVANGEMKVKTSIGLPFQELGSCVALVPAVGRNGNALATMSKVFEELTTDQQLRYFIPPIHTIVELPEDANVASLSDLTIPTVDSLFPLILQQQHAQHDFDPYAAKYAPQQADQEQVTIRLAKMNGKIVANTPVGNNAKFDYPLGKTADNRTIQISLQSTQSKPLYETPPLPRA